MMRNKSQTKEKLLDAVAGVLLEEGFAHLGVNKIAKKAGVDKRLIYRYYGSCDSLIEEFILRKDFWINTIDIIDRALTSSQLLEPKDIIVLFLEKFFNALRHDPVLRQLTLWSLCEPNKPIIRKINRIRSEIYGNIFQKLDSLNPLPNIEIRPVIAMLVAGICYISLRTQSEYDDFCEISVNDELGKAEIIKAVRLISEWTFKTMRGD